MLYQEDELVVVQINDWKKKYYFLEFRMGREGLLRNEATKRHVYLKYKNVNYYSHQNIHLMIWESRPDLDTLDSMLEERIAYFYGALPSNGDMIKDKYLGVNRDLAKGIGAAIIQYFDFEYLSSCETLRFLGVDKGHRFSMPGNYTANLDTVTMKFYPWFHRDCIPACYTEEEKVEITINYYYLEDTVFHHKLQSMICQNDSLCYSKYKKAYNFMNDHEKVACREFAKRDVYNELLRYGGIVKNWLGLELLEDANRNNFNVLNNFLSDCNPPVIQMKDLKSVISMLIIPNSVVPLSISAINFEDRLLSVLSIDSVQVSIISGGETISTALMDP